MVIRIFGFNGVPTARTNHVLQDLMDYYGVYIMAVAQPTHCYDFNGCDALLHSAQKRELRKFKAPLCTNHIVRDWYRACDKICHSRTVQKCFVRALRRNAAGDIDKTLIPAPILGWYDQSKSDSEEERDYKRVFRFNFSGGFFPSGFFKCPLLWV